MPRYDLRDRGVPACTTSEFRELLSKRFEIYVQQRQNLPYLVSSPARVCLSTRYVEALGLFKANCLATASPTTPEGDENVCGGD